MAFRSGLEEKVADLLTNLGVKYEYESKRIPYTLMCNYTPDFLLPNWDLLWKPKGHLTEEDRQQDEGCQKRQP
jgi:hypothetical protein